MKARPVSPALVGFLGILFASLFIAQGLYGLHRDYLFDGNVGRGPATILRLKQSSGGRGNTNYELVYTFAQANGSTREGSLTVSPSTYYRHHQGDHVMIKYLLDQPLQARIVDSTDEDWHWNNDGTALGVGLFFAAIGLILAWEGRPWKKELSQV
jgi:hypothetical protein